MDVGVSSRALCDTRSLLVAAALVAGAAGDARAMPACPPEELAAPVLFKLPAAPAGLEARHQIELDCAGDRCGARWRIEIENRTDRVRSLPVEAGEIFPGAAPIEIAPGQRREVVIEGALEIPAEDQELCPFFFVPAIRPRHFLFVERDPFEERMGYSFVIELGEPRPAAELRIASPEGWEVEVPGTSARRGEVVLDLAKAPGERVLVEVERPREVGVPHGPTATLLLRGSPEDYERLGFGLGYEFGLNMIAIAGAAVEVDSERVVAVPSIGLHLPHTIPLFASFAVSAGLPVQLADGELDVGLRLGVEQSVGPLGAVFTFDFYARGTVDGFVPTLGIRGSL